MDRRAVRVEVLHIEECPSWREAGARLQIALAEAGIDAAVEYRLLEDPADLAGTVFAGSPTIVVDGADLFPAEPIGELACRIYPTPAGLRGMPDTEQLVAALRDLPRAGR
ncbi:thioredoxin family protein [Microbacterium sp. X-17]|uniref:thioredoxin family protein n=1 Tax=Microbacterium sp. X-17 TaxID=3144404 RepID=UPI0031F51B9A